MTTITYGQLVKAVASTLAGAPAVGRVQAYDAISESVPDTPLLQVYAESGEVDAQSDTDRTSFGGGVQVSRLTVQVDGYARRRSHIGEDLQAQMALVDAVDARLSEQRLGLAFGLSAVKSFKWTWERTTFEDVEGHTYAGVRFTLELTIF